MVQARLKEIVKDAAIDIAAQASLGEGIRGWPHYYTPVYAWNNHLVWTTEYFVDKLECLIGAMTEKQFAVLKNTWTVSLEAEA